MNSHMYKYHPITWTLSKGCDMFEYDPSSPRTCKFLPNTPLKTQPWHKVSQRAMTTDTAVFVLQCSTSVENVLKNNDWFTQTTEGWSLGNTCSTKLAGEHHTPSQQPLYVAGGYADALKIECSSSTEVKAIHFFATNLLLTL